MKKHWPFILIALLLVTNAATAVLLVRQSWHNTMWELKMEGQAPYGATLQASADFRAGHLRLYRLTLDGPHEFTGKTEGQFEIWTWPSHADTGHPFAYTAERFVEAYNTRMRNMVVHPEHFEADYEARRKLLSAEMKPEPDRSLNDAGRELKGVGTEAEPEGATSFATISLRNLLLSSVYGGTR